MSDVTRQEKWERAVKYTMDMREEDFETLMDLVRMNQDYHGLAELDALVLVLEQQGVKLE